MIDYKHLHVVSIVLKAKSTEKSKLNYCTINVSVVISVTSIHVDIISCTLVVSKTAIER